MEMATAAISIEPIAFSTPSPDRRERLRRVFSRSADGLYRFILVRVSGDRHSADDLLQQTCHEATRSRRMPENDEEAENWLRGVARNLIRRHWRKVQRQRRHIRLEEAASARQLVEDMESRPLPPDALVKAETARSLMLAITALPVREQRFVFAFYFEGRSHTEIADEAGVSSKSVETRLYRARNRLRTILRNIERT